MRGRLPPFVLLASSLTFLASLFLPWREVAAPPCCTLQGLSSGGGHAIDGWVSGPGDVAVLLVVALVLATVRRPQLAARLPIGSIGVALGYFTVAVVVVLHELSSAFAAGFPGQPHGLHTSWAYGFYLGVASGGIALLSGIACRRNEPLRLRGTADGVAAVLAIALLISFFLPWIGFGQGRDSLSAPGIAFAAAAIVAVALILGAGWLHGEGGRRWRLPLAIAAAVLTGGAASGVEPFSHQRYGAWIGVACAVLLVALEVVRVLPMLLPALPRGLAAVRLGAAALLIVALFLPWQELHSPGTTQGTDGWYFSSGAAAGTLCLVLLLTPALRALEDYALGAIAAIVIFVSILGASFHEDSAVYRIGYGAFVGFAAVGILLVSALLPFRPIRVDRGRALSRAVPLAASGLSVAAVVVPQWYVLPHPWNLQASAVSDLLFVPGVLIALYLARLWVLRVVGPAGTGGRLTLVPLVLLTLPSLELIRGRDGDIVWGAVILIGLCLLLAVLGWIEEDRGLESIRVPEEIWRVDRLPEADA
jgi:hypothetical protein